MSDLRLMAPVASRTAIMPDTGMVDTAPPKDTSLSEQIYTTLKQRLMLGHYLPGDRLSMRKLAEEFGTSPMPVREALKHLASERVIESAAAKAFHVPSLSGKRAADLFDLRALLECAALEAVKPGFSDALIAELSALSERMEAHLKLRDFPAYMLDNYRFHFSLYQLCGNQDMIDMIEQLWMKTGPSLFQGLQLSKADSLKWNASHRRMIEALNKDRFSDFVAFLRADILWGSDFYKS